MPTKEEQQKLFLDAIKQHAKDQIAKNLTPTLTNDDIRKRVGDAIPPGSYGGMVGGLRRKGLIRETGTTKNSEIPDSHGRLLHVYEVTQAGREAFGLPPASALAAATPAAAAAPAGGAAPSAAMEFVDGVRKLCANLKARGLNFRESDVANVLIAMRVRPFILLHGPSGTGKSKLPVTLAEDLAGRHQIVPVRPNWADSSELIGYYSVTKDTFVKGPLLEVLDSCVDNPAKAHVVVLDEMNLARVEHYLAEFLSAMETRVRTKEGIRTKPLALELLPLKKDMDEASQEESALYERLSSLYIPSNLFIVGTVNIDETTFNLSSKVLDRSFPIEYSSCEIDSFPADAAATIAALPDAFAHFLFDPPGATAVPLDVVEARKSAQGDEARKQTWTKVLERLKEIETALKIGGYLISYRTRDAICMYMDAWHKLKAEPLLAFDAALDLCVLQKVLPHLRGSRSLHHKSLQGLWQICAGTPAGDDPERMAVPVGAKYPASGRKILDMLRQYQDGSFSFWLSQSPA